MSNIDNKYKTWDEFLARWPVAAVEAISLDEYTGLDDKETFTYWLEHRLIEYGSIRGGSAYKFGVFRKADTSKEHPAKSYKSDDKYAWHEKFGATSAEAFSNVKKYILEIISDVKSNELSHIELCPLAHTLKWKVAFHYQDQQSPTVLGIFKLEVLQTHLDKELSMAEALKAISSELNYETLITKTDDIWNEWADLESISIWKISHGKSEFLPSVNEWLDKNLYISVHKDTGARQGTNFVSGVKVGDYAYLTNSNVVKAIIKITSEPVIDGNSPIDENWLLRSYQIVYWLDTSQKYTSKYNKGWTPNNNSTFRKVATTELPKFESELLQPFFNVDLAQLIQEGNNMTLDCEQSKVDTSKELVSNQSAKNTILYGPPGTGKTYQTITSSIMAAEPSFDTSLSRNLVKDEYERLVKSGRIQFVTFHQSYGYEEFVEGLKAETDAENQISYKIAKGIFKNICQQASQGFEVEEDPLESAIAQFKADIEEGDSTYLKTLRGKKFEVQFHGNSTFRVFPKETIREDLGQGYPVSIDNIRDQHRGINLEKIYNSSYVKAMLKYLTETYKVDVFQTPQHGHAKNFVLVIDEINRGNISKIFGELITLIEPSKRAGKKEALTIKLPYSQEDFSVPDNLYIIGTMNTADRSLAMMDTALRRRFDFIEMMPDLSVLQNLTVKDIRIDELLRIMNERIETLYDREHTLGHAFFIPVKEACDIGDEDEAWQILQSIFQYKILPLLEEYFFEDWEKIRLVLGDNQKLTEDYQFVIKEELNNEKLKSLFGSKYRDDNFLQSTARYRLNRAAFNSEEAFTYIITGEPVTNSTDTPEE